MSSHSKPFLGKRSSFSTFSPFRAPGSPGQTASYSKYSTREEDIGYGLDSNNITNTYESSSREAHGNRIVGMNYRPSLHSSSSSSSSSTMHAPSCSSPYYLPRRSAYFESHWPLYACDWTHNEWGNRDFVALGTFSEDQNNRILITQARYEGDQSVEFQTTAEVAVSYPATKVKWEPCINNSNDSLSGNGKIMKFITTGDCLRVWDYDCESYNLNQRCALVNKSKSEFLPPVTSFDWNQVNPSIVITSSIDTTCTIWDINTSLAKTQLIAHDSEVYDVSFIANSVDIFASVGADGSVRVFDLRSLDHSTIIYEPQQPTPLLRIAGNPQDRNLLATISHDSSKVYLLDIRFPGVPVAILDGHLKSVNSIQWAPSGTHRRHILASSGDDCQTLIWDTTTISGNATSGISGATVAGSSSTSPNGSRIMNPIRSYTDSTEINQLCWNSTGDWVGTVSGRGFQAVRLRE